MSTGTKRCCAPGCSNRSNNTSGEEISFFRFPKDEGRCSLWKQFVNNPEYNTYSPKECYVRLRLCSLHFEDECFSSMQRNRLKRDALPTWFRLEPLQRLDDQ